MIYAISSLITAFLSIVLGFFILLKNYKERQNQLWFLTSLAIFLWTFGLYRCFVVDNAVAALFWQRILYLGTILIPIFFYHYSIILTRVNSVHKKILTVGYAISLLFLVLIPGDLLIEGILSRNEIGYWPVRLTYLYNFFLLFFISYAFITFFVLRSGVKHETGIRKQQIKFVLYAGLIGYIGGSFNFLLDYNFNYPVGNLFVSLYVIVIAYAITHYRLMGIRLIVSKVYFYSILALFAFVYFYASVYIATHYLGGLYTVRAYSVGFFEAILFAVIFLPLLNKIQRSSDVLFYKGYNPREILRELALRMGSVIKLNEVKKIIASEFKKILATEEVDVIVFPSEAKEDQAKKKNNNKNNEYFTKSVFFKDACADKDSLIYKAALNKKRVIIKDELKSKEAGELAKEMRDHSIEIIAPLMLRSNIVGVILVGEKISQDAYTKEDIEFLEVISSQAAVAIENARLYKEVGDFNKHLKRKVDEQTKDIQTANRELRVQNDLNKELLNMKSDFLRVVHHQLNTPLSVMRGYYSMVKDGSFTPQQAIPSIGSGLERISSTISDFWEAYEIEGELIKMHPEKTDIEAMIKFLVSEKKNSEWAKKRQLNVQYLPLDKPLPSAWCDPKKIMHVISNLLDNAVFYTEKGGVEVFCNIEEDRLRVNIKDTGVGISEADKEILFQKFSRGPKASNVHPDGSGLGLYIAKKMVESSGGELAYISQGEGKGSTFTFTVPIYVGQKSPNAKEDNQMGGKIIYFDQNISKKNEKQKK